MDDDAIIDAIRDHPVDAAEVIIAIQAARGDAAPISLESLTFAAAMNHRDLAEVVLDELVERSLVTAFVAGMQARGVALDEVFVDPDRHIADEALAAFLPKARSFRCRVLKDGEVAGSGVLVGPSLVLTAWHVIAVRAPDEDQEPAPDLEIRLADDTTQTVRIPAALESRCSAAEFLGQAPRDDDDVVGRDDVALLAMDRPAAIHLGYVALNPTAPTPTSQSTMVLVHFPEGQNKGIGLGRARKIRKVKARWRHDVPTSGGSSGGACFNHELELIGIHQGELDNEARFVPIERFLDPVLGRIALDRAPQVLWSLDESPSGQLVIGRADFFRAVAAAGETGRRVRGVRIKRRDVTSGTTGLAFGYTILEQLLVRRGPEHRLVRVSHGRISKDFVAHIRRQADRRGITVPVPIAEPGVAPGAAPPETTAKDRAAVLATAIQSVAEAEGLTVWFFFDNPTVTMSEATRLAFEGFVGAALTKANLRLVIAGFETLPLPGEEFLTPNPSEADRSPGLVVEMMGGFVESDVKDMLSAAAQALTGTVDVQAVQSATDRALFGLESINQFYDDSLLATVADRLRRDLEMLAAQGGGG